MNCAHRNHLTLHMITDNNDERKGFSAQWESKCGENPKDEIYGMIENPKFGIANYEKNRN